MKVLILVKAFYMEAPTLSNFSQIMNVVCSGGAAILMREGHALH